MLAPSSSDAQNAKEPRLIEFRGGIGAVPGVAVAGVYAGIKKHKRDLALVVFAQDQNAVSVITTNEIKAAPVIVSEEHLELRRRQDARARLSIPAAPTPARANAANSTRARRRARQRRCSDSTSSKSWSRRPA